MSKELDKLCINAIRVLSADAIEKSKSGHPGLPLGAATMAYTLWSNMNHNGKNPKWDNRDRFVLSAGHGSMLEYSLLHLFGYGITVEDIKNFRQVGSLTPGHPEYGHTQGVEITTGPLGQGICNAVGMAIAEAHLAEKFNKPGYEVVNHNTYAIVGDGCLMEGISGEASAHGEPLGAENVKAMKENLGWKQEDFYVPAQVYSNMDKYINAGVEKENSWNNLFERYKNEYPELAEEYSKWMSGEIDSESLLNNEELWSFDKEMATRESSGIMINRLANLIPNLIGGSADLAPSNKTYMTGKGDFSAEDRSGRNLHFGVREHAMAAIANGMYAHGGLKVFCATFFVFSDYMKGAMRLSSLMNLPVSYVLTHDSIGVGEDGPTHQPIEQLAALRSMPNMTVFRPADSKETSAAWYYAVTNGSTPTSLVLTRQKLPLYDGCAKRALKGGYILKDSKKEIPDVILMASGSEVELIYKAADELAARGIDARVVSIPSFEIFNAQDEAYKESVLPNSVRKRVAVEALTSFGWYQYVGLDGRIISLDTFGASGNADALFKQFGFTVENVVNETMKLF